MSLPFTTMKISLSTHKKKRREGLANRQTVPALERRRFEQFGFFSPSMCQRAGLNISSSCSAGNANMWGFRGCNLIRETTVTVIFTRQHDITII